MPECGVEPLYECDSNATVQREPQNNAARNTHDLSFALLFQKTCFRRRHDNTQHDRNDTPRATSTSLHLPTALLGPPQQCSAPGIAGQASTNTSAQLTSTTCQAQLSSTNVKRDVGEHTLSSTIVKHNCQARKLSSTKLVRHQQLIKHNCQTHPVNTIVKHNCQARKMSSTKLVRHQQLIKHNCQAQPVNTIVKHEVTTHEQQLPSTTCSTVVKLLAKHRQRFADALGPE